jgi:hypothetical protein
MGDRAAQAGAARIGSQSLEEVPLAVPSFEDFCESICKLIGVQPPSLSEGEEDELAFEVTLDDVQVEFAQDASAGEPGFLMSIQFGPPPAELEATVLAELMNANFELAGVGTPWFSRSRRTRDVYLHKAYTLAQADVHDIYASLARAAGASLQWRKTYCLEQAGHAETQPGLVGILA